MMPVISQSRHGRLHGLLRGLFLAPLLLMLSAGCHDAEGDPLGMVLGEGGEPLALSGELPSLPDLAARAGVTPELRSSLELWESSWDVQVDEGQALRADVYDRVTPELVRTLGAAEAMRQSNALRDALASIDAVGVPADPEVRVAVRTARDLSQRIDEARERGNTALALRLGLEASDALRPFSPSGVARALLEKAEVSLAAHGRSLSERDRTRATRLLNGVESALTAGDGVLAVQRAFYATQILSR